MEDMRWVKFSDYFGSLYRAFHINTCLFPINSYRLSSSKLDYFYGSHLTICYLKMCIQYKFYNQFLTHLTVLR